MKLQIRRIALLLAICLLMGLFGCSKVNPSQQPQHEDQAQQGQQETPTPQPEPEPEPVTVRLVAAGDNLLHEPISYLAEQSDGSYDYRYLYANVKKAIQGSDLAYINEEVMLTDVVSKYPNLSARKECADALIDTGFNVINLASNHALDKGVKGLDACLENVHARKFDAVLGAFRSEEESKQQIVVEKQGIRFGFLSYTYGLNGYSLPGDQQWKVALIDRDVIRSQVTALRSQCDYLIVSMHWGQEYQTKQSTEQEELAQLLSSLGVDLVIGTHPHVIQPAVWYDRPDGGKMYCVYSLGNFASNQHKLYTMLGGLLDMTLEFNAVDGKLMSVKSAGIVPVVMHFQNKYKIQSVYLLQDYTAELAAAHGIKSYTDPLTLEYLNKLADKVLGDQRRLWGE